MTCARIRRLIGVYRELDRPIITTDAEGASFVAVDCVGAGIGEPVLVTTGSSARKALKNQDSPVDAAIVGIIDGSEI